MFKRAAFWMAESAEAEKMKYTILRTDKANDQMYDLIQYIAENADPDTALDDLDDLQREIMKLETTPYMGSCPRYSILKKQGYRVLIVSRHLIFYKVSDQEKQVMIYAVADGRQHDLNLI